MGINANPGAECSSWLKDAGFTNITTQVTILFFIPYSSMCIVLTYSRR